jgi:hypothetical protein
VWIGRAHGGPVGPLPQPPAALVPTTDAGKAIPEMDSEGSGIRPGELDLTGVFVREQTMTITKDLPGTMCSS